MMAWRIRMCASTFDRAGRRATITVLGPRGALPGDSAGIHAAGASFWPLAVARELDDAILHLRLNEPTLGLIVLRSEGDPAAVLAATNCWRRTRTTGWCARSGCY